MFGDATSSQEVHSSSASGLNGLRKNATKGKRGSKPTRPLKTQMQAFGLPSLKGCIPQPEYITLALILTLALALTTASIQPSDAVESKQNVLTLQVKCSLCSPHAPVHTHTHSIAGCSNTPSGVLSFDVSVGKLRGMVLVGVGGRLGEGRMREKSLYMSTMMGQ